MFLGFLRRKSDAFNPPGGYSQLESSFLAALKKQYDLGQRDSAAKKSTPAGTKRKAEASAPAAPPLSTQIAEKTSIPVLEMSPDGSFDATILPTVPKETGLATSVAKTASSAPLDTSSSVAASSTATTSLPAAPGAVEDAAADGEQRGLPGNGGSTDRYTWTQTLDDLQVSFELPAGSRAKDVQCDIKTRLVKVSSSQHNGPLW